MSMCELDDTRTAVADVVAAFDRDPSAVPVEDVQRVLRSAIRAYHAKRAGGEDFPPFADEQSVSATEVVVATANMLKQCDLDVFELGIWIRQGEA